MDQLSIGFSPKKTVLEEPKHGIESCPSIVSHIDITVVRCQANDRLSGWHDVFTVDLRNTSFGLPPKHSLDMLLPKDATIHPTDSLMTL